MRLHCAVLASTLWHVLATPTWMRRISISEDGRATEPRLLRSEVLSAEGAELQGEPRDCEWSNWSNWSSCSATCGGGTQKRGRAVRRKATGGGRCLGDATESRDCNTEVCSRDCTWKAWGTWAFCSETCGGGTSSRSREVKEAKQGEGTCKGDHFERRRCGDQPCPRDCTFTKWSNWTSCEPFCKGVQRRKRLKISDSANGGACGELEQTRECENFCMDCAWSDWGMYSKCSKTCGGGRRSRLRNQTFKERGTPKVPGYTLLRRHCKDHYEDFEGDAAVSNASCAEVCSGDARCRFFSLKDKCYVYDVCEEGGDQVSFRKEEWKKVHGYELKRGLQCTVKPRQVETSLAKAQLECSKDAQCVGLYDSGCSGLVVPCMELTAEAETASCIYEKKEIGGGEICAGNASQTNQCNTQLCTADCKYTDWAPWAACDPKCTGTQHRARKITQQEINGGVPCGKTEEEKPCSTPCVDCQWADWSLWGTCSNSCGGGKQNRSRMIQHQAEGDGENCSGKGVESKDCNAAPCPVDCSTSDWSAWGTCDPFCQGTQSRKRAVERPAAFGGKECGELSESRRCANFCMDCQLSDWGAWDSCSRSCAGGSRQRLRSEIFVQRSAGLLETGRATALGYEKKMSLRCDLAHQRQPNGAGETPEVAEAACSADANCAGLYDEGCNGWLTICSSGFTLEPEPNSCSYVKKEIGRGIACTGDSVKQTEECNSQLCPVDCALSDWSAWDSCVPYCQGTTKRNRTLLQDAQNGGLACGKTSQVKSCSNECVDCEWENFTKWEDCSASCGGGKKKRRRGVKVKAVGGGKNCSGAGVEEQACNTQTCRMDCAWGEWDRWTVCSATCGGGLKKRSRVVKVREADGGKECEGSGEEERACGRKPCPADCAVTPWSEWSRCNPYCLGTQTRSRTVITSSKFGGQACPDLEDSRVCSNYCVDCRWSDWTEMNCSKSCGGGKKRREREQSFQLRGTPSALLPGYTMLGTGQCQNTYENIKDANSPEACALNCSADLRCSFFAVNPGVACKKYNASAGDCTIRPQGANSHSSYRKTKGWKQNFGFELRRHLKCVNARSQRLPLAEAKTVCSADPTCKGLYEEDCAGSALLCDDGANTTEAAACFYRKVEVGGGEACVGGSSQVEECNAELCPVDCKYEDWSDWGRCESCNGTESRSRRIREEGKNGGAQCGETLQQRPCSKICVDCRWSDWTSWERCSSSCGGGLQGRTRYIAVQAEGVGQECAGNTSEMQACNARSCPSDCEMSGWSDWTECSPYCRGLQNRSRAILKPAAFGGASCGSVSETRSCANFCMDCQLSAWNDWSACSLTCAGGSRKRIRNEIFVKRNTASLLQTGEGSAAFGYEKKLGVRCDLEHQQPGASETPDAAESLCSADHNCGGLYDKGCNGQLMICTVGLKLEVEAESCAYLKKEIGDGQPCTGEILESEECNSELCPLDCKQSDWTEWTECKPFCDGAMNRSRKILQRPTNGGAACGSVAEIQNCSNECVDCRWGTWGSWSTCPVSCGGSTQHRSRAELIAQAGRGLPCEGNGTMSRACSEITCPIDCKMSDWSNWTECVPYCKGTQTRARSVLVEPLAGGESCGMASNIANCSNACVDCEVSPWSVWSLCSASCGSGRQSRSRMVLVQQEGEGASCPKDLEDYKEGCNTIDCPVDCAWADWAPWSGCSVTCGGGSKKRHRGKSRNEQSGGSPCDGDADEGGSCSEIACPQDCLWSPWEAWGNCSKTCDGGNRSRYRYVTQIALGEGANCSGEARDSQRCNEEACTKDCEFLDWEDWSVCSASCGIGNHSRVRRVDAEVNGGMPCDPTVPTLQREECSQPCPRDCAWGEWGAWTNCSKSCGNGSSARHRVQAITAAFGGNNCLGEAVEHMRCDKPCPVDCEWKDWTPWTECVQPCGSGGTRQRSRESTGAVNGGEDCAGEAVEVSNCTVLGGCSVNCTWEDWNEWTSCSATCGEGNRVRFRFVADEAVGPHGLPCSGESKEDEYCDGGGQCPVDCQFNDWKDWGSCEPMPCGSPQRLRLRTSQAPRFGGAKCEGNTTQKGNCSIPDIKIIECDANGKPVTSTTTTSRITTTTTERTTTTSFPDIAVTTVGLNADSAAAAASAAASITVEGVETLDVSSPAAFVKDALALKSIKEAIAQQVGVSTDAVIIKSATVQEETASLLSLGSRPRRKRRAPEGQVKVAYEIVPQLNDKNSGDVLDALDKLSAAQAEESLEKSLAHNNAQYVVKVSANEARSISKDDAHVVREGKMQSGAVRSTTAGLFCVFISQF